MSASHKRVHIEGKTFNLKEDSAPGIDADVYYVETQADNTSTANIFQQNLYIDFTISREVDKPTALFLNLLLINNGAQPVSILPSALLIDHLQIWIGKELVDEINGFNLWIDTLTLLTNNTLNKYYGPLSGYDGVTLGPTDTIAAGATLRRFLPLPTLLDQIRPMYSAWPDGVQIRLRIYFASGTYIYTSAATSGLGISSMAMRVVGFVCGNEDIDRDYRSLRSAGDISYRFLQHRLGTSSPAPWTAGSINRVQMNNVNGDVAWLHTTLRSINPQGLQVITPLQWTSHQIESTSQTNMLGLNQVEDAFTRLVLAPDCLSDNETYLRIFLYLDSWVPDLRKVWETGMRLGGNNTFAGKHFLNIIPATSQAYTIDVMAMCYALLKISVNGDVSIEPFLNTS